MSQSLPNLHFLWVNPKTRKSILYNSHSLFIATGSSCSRKSSTTNLAKSKQMYRMTLVIVYKVSIQEFLYRP